MKTYSVVLKIQGIKHKSKKTTNNRMIFGTTTDASLSSTIDMVKKMMILDYKDVVNAELELTSNMEVRKIILK